MRVTRETLMMSIAHLIALRGSCERKKVGAVITLDNRIISTGYNGPLASDDACSSLSCDKTKSCTKSIHAEMNAIAFAARKGLKLEGASLYCTTAPCRNCAIAIIQAGLQRVHYCQEYTDNTGIELLKKSSIFVVQEKNYKFNFEIEKDGNIYSQI